MEGFRVKNLNVWVRDGEIENSSEERRILVGMATAIRAKCETILPPEQGGLWWSRSVPEKGSHATLEGEIPRSIGEEFRHNVTEIADFERGGGISAWH
jgi:hypothetical protein